MDRRIRARLNAFAEGLSGPLGSVPLDRAIRADLGLFQILRESGATWPQIANALAAAGARRPDGSIIPVGHVRSAVTRQLKRSPPYRPIQSHEQPSPRDLPPPAAPSTYSEHPATDEHPETRPTSDKKSRKSNSESDIALTSNQRNQSILAKLARTRKLREP